MNSNKFFKTELIDFTQLRPPDTFNLCRPCKKNSLKLENDYKSLIFFYKKISLENEYLFFQF